MTAPATCATCRWWQCSAPDSVGFTAHCKRMPPTADDRVQNGRWPLTDWNDWCGEHTPKEAAHGQD